MTLMNNKLNKAGLALPALTALAVLAASPVAADTWMEVESARANARAGGPVSEHDAELLERYGCLSGTRSPICQKSNVRRYYGYHTETKRKRKRN